MNDVTKLLDGTVEDVTKRLTGLSAATLAAMLAAEQTGKNRKGVTDAVEEAHTAAAAGGVAYTSTTDRGSAAAATTTTNIAAAAVTTAASLDQSGPANVAPADAFEASGAPVQSSGIDLDHVALDRNPRANTTADQNDFNDPVRASSEIVTDAVVRRGA
jgi:hypothetical protein